MADQLVLVRHGETEWSKSRKHTSRTDLPLTEEGRADARRIGEALREEPFDALLTSPLRRATETAALAFPDATAEVHEALREWDYGDYEGITTPEIRTKQPGWFLWSDGCPNGESPDQIAARTDALLHELEQREGRIALVAHGHLLRVLTARYLQLPAEWGKAFELHTATVSRLGRERDTPTIELWNRSY